MMNNLAKTIAAICLLLTACARETYIDLPTEEPKTVIISHFKPGSPFYMELSRSKSVFDGSPFEVLEKAEASISVGGRFWSRMKFRYDTLLDRTLWISKDVPIPGVVYTVSVKIPEEPDVLVEASSSIPAAYDLLPVKMDTAQTKVVQLPDSTFALRVPVQLKLKYLPPDKRFFAFQFSHETEVFRVVNGQQVSDYVYTANSSFTTDGRTLSLLNDISGAEPVVLINEKFWSDGLETLRLDAIIPFSPGRETPKLLFVEWRTLSEEFYRYHLSLARQGSNLPLSDPDAVYNNVVNGFGNFSGYSVDYDTIRLPRF